MEDRKIDTLYWSENIAGHSYLDQDFWKNIQEDILQNDFFYVIDDTENIQIGLAECFADPLMPDVIYQVFEENGKLILRFAP